MARRAPRALARGRRAAGNSGAVRRCGDRSGAARAAFRRRLGRRRVARDAHARGSALHGVWPPANRCAPRCSPRSRRCRRARGARGRRRRRLPQQRSPWRASSRSTTAITSSPGARRKRAAPTTRSCCNTPAGVGLRERVERVREDRRRVAAPLSDGACRASPRARAPAHANRRALHLGGGASARRCDRRDNSLRCASVVALDGVPLADSRSELGAATLYE